MNAVTQPPQSEHKWGVVSLAVIGTFGLLFMIGGGVTKGFGGVLLGAGLTLLVLGAGGALINRPWWALIPSRKAGAGLLVAGLVLAIAGGVVAPRSAVTPSAASQAAALSSAEPTSSSPTSSSSTSSSAASSSPTRPTPPTTPTAPTLTSGQIDVLVAGATPGTALALLGALEVTTILTSAVFSAADFGLEWADVDTNGCDTANDILARDLQDVRLVVGGNTCVVASGQLLDTYTAATIKFTRDAGGKTETVNIDHVVSLLDSWTKGAQTWDAATRLAFANDPFDLLAVDAPTSLAKNAADAATWLPPSKADHCGYVAQQVAVKAKYRLGISAAERAAIARVLSVCPLQPLPVDIAALAAASAAESSQQAAAASAAASALAQAEAERQAAEAAAVAAASHQIEPAPVPAPAPVPEPAPAPAPAPAPQPEPPNGVTVNPGSFCAPLGAVGVTSKGTPMVCGPGSDGRNRWHKP